MTDQKLFLFDFDGVLADSLDLYAEAVTRCLERIGTPIVKSKEDYLALFDGNFYESMAARGVDLEAFTRAAMEILPRMDYNSMRPFDGLIPVLASLKKDHLLAVISSNGSPTIRRMIERFGFTPYFEEILGSDFLFSKKEKIDHALAKYGIPPERTFYIGDTVGDIKEARAAGVRTVAVTWGWHSRERLAVAHPDFLVDTPEELLQIGFVGGLMTLDSVEVLWVLNLLPSEELPNVAVRLLMEDVDCESLRMLAGLTSQELTDASDLFAQALKELDRPALSKRDAAIRYTKYISDKIVRGEISPYDGATMIWHVSVGLDAHLHEADPFIYAVSEIDDRPKDRDFFISEIVKEAQRWSKNDS